MGYIKYDAIIVSGEIRERVEAAWMVAKRYLPDTTSAIVYHPVNSGASFFIAPDGSKEGWPDEDPYNDAMAEFGDWAGSLNFIEGFGCSFIHVRYGGDDDNAEIKRIIR